MYISKNISLCNENFIFLTTSQILATKRHPLKDMKKIIKYRDIYFGKVLTSPILITHPLWSQPSSKLYII